MNRQANAQVKQEQKTLIISKLSNAGIKVRSGNKISKRDGYSGIVGDDKKVLELNI